MLFPSVFFVHYLVKLAQVHIYVSASFRQSRLHQAVVVAVLQLPSRGIQLGPLPRYVLLILHAIPEVPPAASAAVDVLNGEVAVEYASGAFGIQALVSLSSKAHRLIRCTLVILHFIQSLFKVFDFA